MNRLLKEFEYEKHMRGVLKQNWQRTDSKGQVSWKFSEDPRERESTRDRDTCLCLYDENDNPVP